MATQIVTSINGLTKDQITKGETIAAESLVQQYRTASRAVRDLIDDFGSVMREKRLGETPEEKLERLASIHKDYLELWGDILGDLDKESIGIKKH